MAGVNLSNMNLAQIDYEKLIVDALATGANAFRIPAVKNWEGDVIDWRVNVERNPNHGFTEDGGAYSVPGSQGYATARAGRRFFEKKLQITLGAMAAARSEKRAFRSVVDSEVRGATRDVMSWYNKMFFLDGTGVVATLLDGSQDGSTTSIKVDSNRLLWKNGSVQVYDDTLTTLLGELVVAKAHKNLNASGQALVDFTSAIPNIDTNDVLVWKGSLNRAIAGLDVLIDDSATTFQNVNVSTYPEYSSYVSSNSGTARPLTPQILRQTLAALMQSAGNDFRSRPLTVFGNAWLLKEFEEMYEGAYRFQGEGAQGYKGVKFTSVLGEVRMSVDTDCPKGKLFLCDTSQLVHAVQKPMGFERDGSELFRTSHQSQHATAVMTCISQMMIKDRKTSAKIEDLEDAATIAL